VKGGRRRENEEEGARRGAAEVLAPILLGWFRFPSKKHVKGRGSLRRLETWTLEIRGRRSVNSRKGGYNWVVESKGGLKTSKKRGHEGVSWGSRGGGAFGEPP